MDLESSALEYVDDNEVIPTIEKFDSVNDSDKVEINGKVVDGTEEPVNSRPILVRNGSSSPSPETAIKGFGLRKWRRIKREVTNDGVESIDNSKLLKRGLSNGVEQSGKPMQVSADVMQTSEGSVSVSSTNAIGKGLGIVMGPVFAAGGTDSENSEDQSSKSSTAASVPKTGACDKYTSGKNLGSPVQRVQQEKVEIDMSKKPRGGRVKIEKENSHSSMESDSRSSNFVFMQGTTYSVTSNGTHGGRSLNYDEDNSDEAQGIDQQVSEELEAGYGRKNNGDFEDDFHGNLAQGCSTDQDPLIESIQSFQSVQEAFEREVQKFKEIGIDDSIQDSCLPSEIEERSFLEQLHSGVALEPEIISLKEKARFLENKLHEITGMLEVKETKVVELETILDKMDLHTGNHKDMESELEALFRQKIEAEVEYLAISRTLQNVDQISVLGEQRKLASEQSRIVERIVEKLGDAEAKSLKVKREAQELDIASVDETLKLQSNVCKYTSCFFIQLMLLTVILVFLVSQLSPHSSGVVPT